MKTDAVVPIFANHVDDYKGIAQRILTENQQSRIFIFRGQLGAGKTTLIKELCKVLGYHGEVTSPTFSLINEYDSAGNKIYHMDLYRVKDVDEAIDFGIEEYLYSDAFCFIEWPDIVMDLLPENFYTVEIETADPSTQQRKITVMYHV